MCSVNCFCRLTTIIFAGFSQVDEGLIAFRDGTGYPRLPGNEASMEFRLADRIEVGGWSGLHTGIFNDFVDDLRERTGLKATVTAVDEPLSGGKLVYRVDVEGPKARVEQAYQMYMRWVLDTVLDA